MPTRKIAVPLLVLALAAALFFWRNSLDAPVVDLPSDVRVCAENLRAIYAGLLLYKQRFGHAPEGSGVAFLGALIASGVWEDTSENRARLTCPGPRATPVPRNVDYKQLAALTGEHSAYAARDVEHFPLARFPSGGSQIEPLVACDNARALNHDGCMNVLYSDGSVVVLTLEQEQANGHLAAGAQTMPVGKGSPVPDLVKLRGD